MTIPALLAAAALSLLAAQPAAAQDDDFRDIPFVVTELRGNPPVDGITQTATFGSNGTISGEGGCNGFSAGFIVMSEAIMVQPARSTRKACEPAIMEAEKRMLDALSVVVEVEYDADAGTLVLKGADRRAVMRLARQDG